MIGGLHRAVVDAARELGVGASLIMCFLRHLDETDAEKTLDRALAFKDKIVEWDWIYPSSQSAEQVCPVFRRAR